MIFIPFFAYDMGGRMAEAGQKSNFGVVRRIVGGGEFFRDAWGLRAN